jgi:YjjG family noncanonical pyrimidine nucleotidase
MPYTTVLFDLDHTLLDSDASESAAFAGTMRMAGVSDPQPLFDTYRRINLAMWAQVEAGTMLADDVRRQRFEEFNRVTGIDADPHEMAEVFVRELGDNGDLYPDARETLERLTAIVSLALVTNGISAVQRARVSRLGLDRYFDAIVVSSEVAAAKPGKAIFDIAFERLGRPDRQSTVIIGDSLSSDMAGGRGYGIATCWYNPTGREAEPGTHLDHIVSDFDQVVDIVCT